MLKTVEDVSSTRKRITIEIPSMRSSERSESLEKVRRPLRSPAQSRQGPHGYDREEIREESSRGRSGPPHPQVYVDALKEAEITPSATRCWSMRSTSSEPAPVDDTHRRDDAEIEDLKYEGIAVRAFPVAVDDSEVEGVLKRMQEEKATYEPSDGPVEMSDLVVLDYITPRET